MINNLLRICAYTYIFLILLVPMYYSTSVNFDINVYISVASILGFFAGLINSLREEGIKVRFILPNFRNTSIHHNIKTLPPVGSSYYINSKEYIVIKINYIHNEPIEIILDDTIN